PAMRFCGCRQWYSAHRSADSPGSSSALCLALQRRQRCWSHAAAVRRSRNPLPVILTSMKTEKISRTRKPAKTAARHGLACACLSWKARIGGAIRGEARARMPLPVVRGPRLEPRFDGDAAYEDQSYEDEDAVPAPRRRPAPRPPARRSGSGYMLPSLNLLAAQRANERMTLSREIIDGNAVALESVLQDFGVRGEIINARPGPVVTLYELEQAPGIKSSRVIGLADDIARSMSAVSARVAVVSGRNAIGIELPNPTREKVYLRELLTGEDYNETAAKLPLCLGKTIGGESVIVDLSRMP